MHNKMKLLMAGISCFAFALSCAGCATSQSAAEEATTEVIIQETIPSDENNAKLVESLRFFTDMRQVLKESYAAGRAAAEEKKANKTEKKEETTEAATTEAVSTEVASTEVKSEKNTAAEATTTAEEASTEVKKEVVDPLRKEIKTLSLKDYTEGFALGGVTDNTYSNAYFNIAYSLDPTWTVDSREQMLKADHIEVPAMDETTLKNAMQGVSQFRDLQVTIQDGEANIIITTMNLDYYKKQFQGAESAKEYYYVKLYKILKKQGYKDILVTQDTVKQAGKDFEVLDIQMKDGDIPYFVKAMFTKKDHFMDIILLTSRNQNNTDILMKSLTKAK